MSVIYLIGGPFDLTKMEVNKNPGRNFLMYDPECVPAYDHPDARNEPVAANRLIYQQCGRIKDGWIYEYEGRE